MPEIITSALVDEKNTQHNLHPWIWLVELQATDTEAIRLAGYSSDVVHNGQTYSASSISIGVQSRDRDGVLQEVELTAGNPGAWLSVHVDEGRILDRNCKVKLVNSEVLTDVVHEGLYLVREASLKLEAASFRLALPGLINAPVPAQLFHRTRCQWRYGGAGCNYNLNLPNAISGTHPEFNPASCDLTRDGPNGCRAHGDNEQANGVPRQHPRFFRGFPGIPKGPARV